MSNHPLAKSRQIRQRWVIEGDLVLQTPTHLGNGDSDGMVDMPLLLDETTGRALLLELAVRLLGAGFSCCWMKRQAGLCFRALRWPARYAITCRSVSTASGGVSLIV